MGILVPSLNVSPDAANHQLRRQSHSETESINTEESTKDSKGDDTTKANSSHNTASRRLSEQCDNLQQRVEKVENENAALKQENAVLTKWIDSFEQKYATLEKSNATLEQRIAKLLQENAAREKRNATLERKTAKLERRIATLEQKNAVLERKYEALEQENAVLKEHIDTYEQRIQMLEKQIEELESGGASSGREDVAVQQEIKNLTEEYQKLREEVTSVWTSQCVLSRHALLHDSRERMRDTRKGTLSGVYADLTIDAQLSPLGNRRTILDRVSLYVFGKKPEA
ncbi:hypothetical protein AX17_005232 [Amanita inopinata Kibby_2008]|nr:hypothetical protein AX17_005232 [Amanita inopinata Kibby_2008]